MKQFVLGIDLGGTNIKIGLLSHKNEVILRTNLSTKRYKHNKQSLISALIMAIEDIISRKALQKKDILGLGLGLPGPIDILRGIVHFFPNIPGWQNVPLRSILRNALRLPTFIDNDANLVALAEWKVGAGVGTNNLVCLTLGTGVGGGLIIERKLYRGTNFSAGEIGHVPINEDGPSCNCGGRACLERYVGNRYILKQARHLLKKKKMSLEELSLLAKGGNSKAIQIWQSVAQHIGVALTGIVNVFNPERIVIGGGVASAGTLLIKTIEKTIKERAMPTQAKLVRVVKAKLGDNAGIIGCAILVRDNLSSLH